MQQRYDYDYQRYQAGAARQQWIPTDAPMGYAAPNDDLSDHAGAPWLGFGNPPPRKQSQGVSKIGS